ncbi:ribosome assembly RNA-binding protein YhbY [Aquibacillus albus]|uniref:RNA-binding protein n=1 Tax=Aquibacillus albus TaxID=1168171 RepID=A0ABS2MUP9_9BACI|nr:ribosome assembly RNA-binding protein YhbY [Aquibacillus albus]MBM7569594.1 RNA-binding protein [Aquibacillus albus]
MLTGKQKRYLRSQAHHLNAIFQVGKTGVNENMIQQIDDVLEKRELIKISVLQNCLEDKEEVAQTLTEATSANLVQVIGNTIVLYRESSEDKRIELPN